jgi:hypothetical protein
VGPRVGGRRGRARARYGLRKGHWSRGARRAPHASAPTAQTLLIPPFPTPSRPSIAPSIPTCSSPSTFPKLTDSKLATIESVLTEYIPSLVKSFDTPFH